MKSGIVASLVLSLSFSCGTHAENESEAGAKTTVYSGGGGTTPNVTSPETTGQSIESRLLDHFKYTDDFDADSKLYLTYDMQNLAHWSDTTRPAALQKLGEVTGLTTVSAETLSEWYMERVTYLYPNNSDAFAIGLIIPDESGVYQTSFDTGAVNGVAALNISASLYQILDNNRDQGVEGLQFLFNGSYLPYLSTHNGVVKMGPNLIANDDELEKGQSYGKGYRLVKSLFRLNVLLHEARHGDGNTKADTFGFAHSLCPGDGSVAVELAGLPACDKYANGAYNVGAQVISALIGMCDGICSASDTGGLDAARIDVLSRILVDDNPEHYGDATPETALEQIDTSSFSVFEDD